MIHYQLTAKPSAPTEPFVTDNITKNPVDLSWGPPDNNGGSPITGYVIEKKERSMTRWTHLTKTSDDSRKTQLKNLTTGMEVMFRVSAGNKLGTSEPLEMRKMITIKSPFGE